MRVEWMETERLVPYERNAKRHPEDQVNKIASSIKHFGFKQPLIIDGNNEIIAGHGRLEAARKLGMEEVPCIRADDLTEAQVKAYRLADNRTAESAWDWDLVKVELEELQGFDFDIEVTGFDEEEISQLLDQEGDSGEDQANQQQSQSLSDRFMAPPFSILNGNAGWWQQRKRAWLSLGIQSEVGRGGLGQSVEQTGNVTEDRIKRERECNITGAPPLPEWAEGNNRVANIAPGGSVFDPVLCELMYRWFTPDRGVVLDPFAGGSVRGVVASRLGLEYHGVELREEQVQANRQQEQELCESPRPTWYVGDSKSIDNICKGVEADFLFTCPPYADLEVYSHEPEDISRLGYNDFRTAYREIIERSCGLLKNNSFACVVVSEVRNKKGNYYGFVPDTISSFEDAGLKYYNEAILINPPGSLPIRAGRVFNASRKLGKHHQNVLIFVKGDAKQAAQNCGSIDFTDDVLWLYGDGTTTDDKHL